MEEFEEQRHFFDAPMFLDGIASVVLGFGGAILFLVVFIITLLLG